MKTLLRGARYGRYSSERQQETSITVQFAEINKFCKANGIEIVASYADEARTGTDGEREQFQQMLADAALGTFDVVVVHRWDRFARNVELALAAKKELELCGVKIISTVENFDDTPEGDFFSLMSLGMAALYSKRLSRESFNGQLENARLGNAHAGTPIYGYEVVKKQYRLVPKEAEAMRIMFQMIAAGKTYRETVDYLNAQGYRRRDGRPLSYFITDRLRNRQYTGEYVFNLYKHVKTKDGRKYKRKSESEVIRIPNGMPAIIDTETFEKVQQKMDARKSHKIRKVHGKYLLTGLITCGICSGAISGTQSTVRGKPYCSYRCCGKAAHDTRPQIAVVLLDKYIVNLFTQAFLLYRNTEKLTELMRQCLDKIQDDKIARQQALKEQYKEHTETIAALEEIIARNKGKALAAVVANDLASEKEKAAELEALQEGLKAERSRIPRLNRETIVRQARAFKTVLESIDFRAKQELLHKLVESIEINEETIETTINLHVIAGVALPLKCTVIEEKQNAATGYDLLGLDFSFDRLTVRI